RRGDGDLPARVFFPPLARDARHPDRGGQPGRRPVDRLWPVRPRLLHPVPGRGDRQALLPRREGLRTTGAHLGGADHGGADPPRRHRGDGGGAARGPARAARGLAGAGRDQVADGDARGGAAGGARHPDRHHPGRQPRRRRGGAHPLHGRGLLSTPAAQASFVSIHVAELPCVRPLHAVSRCRRHQADPLRHRAGAARADLHAQHRGGVRAGADAPPARGAGVTANGVPKPEEQAKLIVRNLAVYYGEKKAVGPVAMDIVGQHVTALIGPSGCGKSTFLRSLNRMNELIAGCRVEGDVRLDGDPIYGRGIDPVAVRRRIGMVFQRSNPFPKSIAENVAYGLRIGGLSDARDIAARVERALTQAALWEEVKDRLDDSALALSGGQQQRICIARALAVEPEALLMDEPTSALDPIATLRIEELMRELVKRYTIVIVTHNMQQAARVSDITAFMTMGTDRAGI